MWYHIRMPYQTIRQRAIEMTKMAQGVWWIGIAWCHKHDRHLVISQTWRRQKKPIFCRPYATWDILLYHKRHKSSTPLPTSSGHGVPGVHCVAGWCSCLFAFMEDGLRETCTYALCLHPRTYALCEGASGGAVSYYVSFCVTVCTCA